MIGHSISLNPWDYEYKFCFVNRKLPVDNSQYDLFPHNKFCLKMTIILIVITKGITFDILYCVYIYMADPDSCERGGCLYIYYSYFNSFILIFLLISKENTFTVADNLNINIHSY